MARTESMSDFMIRTIAEEMELLGIHKKVEDIFFGKDKEEKDYVVFHFKPETNKFLIKDLQYVFPPNSFVSDTKKQFILNL